MFNVLSHLSNRHLSRSLTGNPSHVSEGLRKLYCEQKHSISHVRKNIFYHKVIFFCVCKKIISCYCLAHVRYIKILSWLQIFQDSNVEQFPGETSAQRKPDQNNDQKASESRQNLNISNVGYFDRTSPILLRILQNKIHSILDSFRCIFPRSRTTLLLLGFFHQL